MLPLLSLGACSGDSGNDLDAGPDIIVDPCTTHLAAGASDQSTVQTALIEASSGDVLCFDPGTYHFTDELSLTVANVTLRSTDFERPAVLDFGDQTVGGNGIHVTAGNFVIERLTVLDPPGDGVRVTGVTNVTMRGVKILWSTPGRTENGAYGLYPVTCTNVLIEDCEVVGASDAGVYVGQSHNIIVRNNLVHGNVAGIEIENSQDAEVYGNLTYNNTAGILVFNLPGLPMKDGRRTRIHDNIVEGNNHTNFALEGNIVASVPMGTGVLIMANDQVEVDHNTIVGNAGTGVALVAYDILGLPYNDPGFDAVPETIYIHDNVIIDNGFFPEPGSLYSLIGTPVPDIIWDGTVKGDLTDGTRVCVGGENGGARFFRLNPGSDDPTMCTHPELPAITMPQGL